MATISRFEDLEIWQTARELSREVCRIADRDAFKSDYRLKSQMKAASGSVTDNIAEGFEREGNAEFKQALFISKGSAGETRSQLYRAYDQGFITEEELTDLIYRYEKLSVKIRNFIEYLKTSDIKGFKYRK